MSNHKMQFPSHISKSWLSVCIFIFFLAVCVGLAIHVTSEEDAICSDSDHSEVPIVSNENVSEKSGSDIEHPFPQLPVLMTTLWRKLSLRPSKRKKPTAENIHLNGISGKA